MKAAIDLGEEILALIEDDVPEWALDKAPDFFEGVQEKTESILEVIRNSGKRTDRQLEALENMLAGVKKWIR